MINNEHLEFEELLLFSTIDGLSDENKELAARVWGHLRSCAECRRTLDGIQNFSYALDREQAMEGYGRSLASVRSTRKGKTGGDDLLCAIEKELAEREQ